MMDQNWWKDWFIDLKKDGHTELVHLYNTIKLKNPLMFEKLMDEIWQVNNGSMQNFQIDEKKHDFMRRQFDKRQYMKRQLEMFQ